ncbi:VanZ family protein [Gorillibacterium massiliense]|uniref:VanZ family protein n=1 Tax=Gorillibacterium massiliense TaxID=1280390 RepID=UPI002351EC0A|nr:VanZ family protein [Gorillibacterium massiliense]
MSGVLLLAVAAAIFFFSSQTYSQQNLIPKMRTYIQEDTLARMLPDMEIEYNGKLLQAKKSPYQFTQVILRKGAHLFMYGLLACAISFVLTFYKWAKWKKAMLLYGVVISIAALDEWNQRSSFQRTSKPSDVVIDVIGATLGVAISLLAMTAFRSVKQRKINNQN